MASNVVLATKEFKVVRMTSLPMSPTALVHAISDKNGGGSA